jgi:hypothetical protein
LAAASRRIAPADQRTDAKKNGDARGTAKFREETSKKADSPVSDRVAAVHNLARAHMERKQFFALHHCFFIGQFPEPYFSAH